MRCNSGAFALPLWPSSLSHVVPSGLIVPKSDSGRREIAALSDCPGELARCAFSGIWFEHAQLMRAVLAFQPALTGNDGSEADGWRSEDSKEQDKGGLVFSSLGVGSH